MINYKKLPVFVLIVCTLHSFCNYAQSNPSQLLKNWVSSLESGTEPILPNFSYAGYHNGEIGLPTSFSQTVYNVTDTAYGAVADDGNSDKDAILAAIAAAELNPSGGIVFFPPGEFHINETSDDVDEIIRISKSNVVLKGSGSGAGGTTLIQTSYTNPTNPNNYWTCPYLIQFKPSSTNRTHITNITANATRETYDVQVASTTGISVGQWVRLKLSDNDTNLIAAEFAPYAVVASYTSIAAEVKTWEIHKVEAINGNTITFVEPIHKTIDSSYDWNLETFPVIEEVGIQDLNYEGGMDTSFVHHSGWQQDSGWSGIEFNQVANGWISNVYFTQMSNAAQLKLTGYSSAIQNNYYGNPGHAFISANASTGCLIGLNTDNSTGIHHGCGVSGPSIGNTLWRNEMPTDGNSGTEIHANQPRANLIDACKGGLGMNYGGSVSNQPNHLRHLVLWNFEGKGYVDTNFEFWRNNYTYAKIIPPIVSGLVGFTISEDTSQSISGTDKQYQENESPGTHVDETSLYEAQLTHRLGALPIWIESALRTETFENTTITGWSTETYTGNNNIDWTLVAKSTSGYIDTSKNIYVQSGKTGATSATISGGISSFSVKCKNLWDSGVDRNLELIINGSVVGSMTHSGTEIYSFDVNNIDIEGDFTLAIKNASPTGSNKSVAFDNLTWTSYTPFHPASVEIPANASLQIGDTTTLNETVYPSYAADSSVSWSSSDTSIVTVSSNGLVTGISTGIAIITASTTDGGLTASCEIAVGATETFENTTITGWSTETYTGDNGFVWTLNSKSTSGYINGSKDIYMRSGKVGAQSGNIPGGIGTFTVTCKDLWDTGVERTIELLVNGNVVDTFTHTGSEIYTYTVEDINIAGTFTLGIKNASPTNTNKSIALDDLSWTPYSTQSGSKEATKIKEEVVEESIVTTKIYPNPFHNELHVLIAPIISRIEMYDTHGRLVLSKNTEGNSELTFSPSFSQVPAGMYYIRLIGSTEIKTIPLIRK